MSEWWKTFFNADYIRLWSGFDKPGHTAAQVAGLWEVLALAEGMRVLDAPCGYGRLSLPLAERGAIVVGVDQSAELIAHAESGRGKIPESRLRYLRRDLREPFAESGFDVAVNIYSSLGYGAEQDDLAIVKTLHAAVRPGGLVFIEGMHRDAAVDFFSRGERPADRLPDGTLIIEEPAFDAVAGRVNTRWFWWGPAGHGEKAASLRLYSVTELVRLLESAGLKYVSAHRGCSPELFKAEGPQMGGRIGLLARKE